MISDRIVLERVASVDTSDKTVGLPLASFRYDSSHLKLQLGCRRNHGTHSPNDHARVKL